MQTLWGVDLGGTKIEAAIIEYDGSSINVLERQRVPTEASQGYDHILAQIKKLIDSLKVKTKLTPSHIGFSTPGTLDPSSQTLKNCNTTCLNGQSFKTDVEDLLNLPIRMANDANCFVLAETKFGVVKNIDPKPEAVFGIIMGTGVGGGLVVHEQLVTGRHGIGGEWGHNHIDDSGGDCYCGKKGCVETMISGPSLERYYEQISGNKKSLKEIVELYRNANDINANKTMDRMFKTFGKALSQIVNVVDPEVILIGGGLGNIDELYTMGKEELRQHIFNNKKLETTFLKPELGDSAGVFGAAIL